MTPFDLDAYHVVPRGGLWPARECVILDAERGACAAVVREEPWREMLIRPWPDGVAKLPWLPWLLGHAHRTEPSRTVVRMSADGRPVLRLHRRPPIFHQTIGIFDPSDVRIGYCRGAFKQGLRDHFVIANLDHQTFGTVRGDGATYRFTGADPLREFGTMTASEGARWEVTVGAAARDDAVARLYLLAATLVLIELRSSKR